MVTDPMKPQIVNPPNPLRNKVSGSGPISQEMLKRAEGAVEALAAQFNTLLESDLDRLSELVDLGAREPSRRMDVVKQIFDIAHDLRGQAGTFNYPLITRVGTSLCRFTEGLDACGERELEVIRLHIEAMQAILASSLRGDGDDVGKQIAHGLEAAVGKLLS
jgi:chemotaxis protein histidine kinase CheA